MIDNQLFCDYKVKLLFYGLPSGLHYGIKEEFFLLTIHKLKILLGDTSTVYRKYSRLSEMLFSVANCMFLKIY